MGSSQVDRNSPLKIRNEGQCPHVIETVLLVEVKGEWIKKGVCEYHADVWVGFSPERAVRYPTTEDVEQTIQSIKGVMSGGP